MNMMVLLTSSSFITYTNGDHFEVIKKVNDDAMSYWCTYTNTEILSNNMNSELWSPSHNIIRNLGYLNERALQSL